MNHSTACKSCDGNLLAEPVLRLENVPKSAQGFSKTQSDALEQCAELVLYQCTCCGLVQLTSPPVAYFREVIRSAAVSPILLQQKKTQLASFIDQHALKGKKIVEIGCGRGEFLSVLGQLDVQSYGIEYSSTSVEKCISDGLTVEKQYLESSDVQLRDGPFDAFLLLMFLEHMPSPREALKAIANNLATGAVGLIEVPSLDFLLRKKLLTEFIPDHLTYFSRTTLSSLLSISGFEVLEMRESRDDYVLTAVVRKQIPLILKHSSPASGQLAADLQAFLTLHADERIAVWGAGHQALTTISVLGIAGQLSMIVDSAPSKQGLYSPGSGLLIEPPSALDSNAIDVVIVMAGSYSREIVDILIHSFPHIKHIAVAMEDHLSFPLLNQETR